MENNCKRKDAVKFANSKFCLRDTSKTFYVPGSCKILKAKSENIGFS